MSFYSFRDRPKLSERIRGKSGDELFKELRKELDQDRKLFFDSPTSNWGSSTGSSFPRAGHLFEEPLMRGHTDIRSHLEDLAQRHPEFADQLRYPAWSNDSPNNTWRRKRRGSGSGQPDSGEASKQQPQEQQQETSEPEEDPLRGRPKENLRNTVPDMGQKQQQETEDKESRGQRSWSAPPDNRTQQTEKPRFISKIEINPVNPDATQTPTGDATKPPMAPPKPQPQPQPQQQPHPQTQPKQSNVRHIPIFVEGRDEPVLPKNVEPEFTQTQAPPQQHFSRPPPQSQYTSPPSHHHFQPQKNTARKQTPPRYEQQPPPQAPPPQQSEQPEVPPVNPRDPLYRVGCVQKEVDELKAKVENFSGNSRSDKEYIILDELLTRNLIKLDDIETEGKEEVRAARKNTIRSIQRCISVLENKVPVPGCEKQEAETMEVEQQPSEIKSEETNVNHKGDNTSDNKSEQSSDEKQMEVASTQDANDPKQTQATNNEVLLTNSTNEEPPAATGSNEVPSGEEKAMPGEASKEVSSTGDSENKTA